MNSTSLIIIDEVISYSTVSVLSIVLLFMMAYLFYLFSKIDERPLLHFLGYVFSFGIFRLSYFVFHLAALELSSMILERLALAGYNVASACYYGSVFFLFGYFRVNRIARIILCGSAYVIITTQGLLSVGIFFLRDKDQYGGVSKASQMVIDIITYSFHMILCVLLVVAFAYWSFTLWRSLNTSKYITLEEDLVGMASPLSVKMCVCFLILMAIAFGIKSILNLIRIILIAGSVTSPIWSILSFSVSAFVLDVVPMFLIAFCLKTSVFSDYRE